MYRATMTFRVTPAAHPSAREGLISRAFLLASGLALLSCSGDSTALPTAVQTASGPSGAESNTTSGGVLQFPLHNADGSVGNPRTWRMTSVYDHSLPAECYKAGRNHEVIDFTGLRANRDRFVPEEGSPPEYQPTDAVSVTGIPQYNITFLGSAKYAGGTNHLPYDGHCGNDLGANYGDTVFAPISGKVHYDSAAFGETDPYGTHTLSIWGAGGIVVFLQHLATGKDEKKAPLRYIDKNGVGGPCPSFCVEEGADVVAGKPVGLVGRFYNHQWNGVEKHLHLGVSRNGTSLDPYGWQGGCVDPLNGGASVNLWDNRLATVRSSFTAQGSSGTVYSCQNGLMEASETNGAAAVTLTATPTGTLSTTSATYQWIVNFAVVSQAKSFSWSLPAGDNDIQLVVTDNGSVSASYATAKVVGGSCRVGDKVPSVSSSRLAGTASSAGALDCGPSPVTAFTATARDTISVALSWALATANVTALRIERCTGANCAAFALLTSLPANTLAYVDKGLSPSTAYTYRIVATTAAGDAAPSNTATATTPAAQVLSTTRTISLSVMPVGSGTVSLNGGNATAMVTDKFPHGDIVSAKAIPASNSFVFKSWTSSDGATYLDNPHPITATSDMSLLANFETAPPAQQYTINVQSSVLSAGTVSGSATLIAGAQATATAFPSSGFVFKEWRQNSESGSVLSTQNPYSFPVTGTLTLVATFANNPPAGPTGATGVALSPTSIKLDWHDQATAEDGYILECAVGNGAFAQVTTLGANVETYTVSGLSHSTTYSCRVAATNTGGSSPWSNVVTVTTPAPQVVLAASLTLTPATATVAIGSTATLTATAKDTAGAILTYVIDFTSSVPAVATVSATGLVTGVSEGTSTITASVDGKTATAVITVPAPTPPPVVTAASIVLSPVTHSMRVGDTLLLVLTIKDANGNVLIARPKVYASSAQGVATVAQSGVVTAVAAGTAGITATVDGISATSSITVTAAPPAVDLVVKRIVLAPLPTLIAVGDSVRGVATAYNAAGDVVPATGLTWSTATTSIRVSALGWVKGIYAGAADVQATVNSTSAHVLTVVYDPAVATRVVVSPSAATLVKGDSLLFTATAFNGIGAPLSHPAVRWISRSAMSVVVVRPSGWAVAVANGVDDIIADVNGVRDTSTVTVVTPVPAHVSLASRSGRVSIGRTISLPVQVTDSMGHILASPVTWLSRDPSIATVDASGLVTGVWKGVVRVLATAGAAADSATITVDTTGVLIVTLQGVPTGAAPLVKVYPPSAPSGYYAMINISTVFGTAGVGRWVIEPPQFQFQGKTYTANWPSSYYDVTTGNETYVTVVYSSP